LPNAGINRGGMDRDKVFAALFGEERFSDLYNSTSAVIDYRPDIPVIGPVFGPYRCASSAQR
jgi:hypothetical protein